jgi:hypothetical protein
MDALSVGALTLLVQAEAVVSQLRVASFLDEVPLPSSRAVLADELAALVEAAREAWTLRQEAEVDVQVAYAAAERAADEVTAWAALARSALKALADQAPDQAFEARSLSAAMGQTPRRVASRLAWARTFEPLMLARAAAAPAQLGALMEGLRQISTVRASLAAAMDAQARAIEARTAAVARTAAAVEQVREKVRAVWAWWRLAQLQRPGLPDLDLTYARVKRAQAAAAFSATPTPTEPGGEAVAPIEPELGVVCPPDSGPTELEVGAVVTLGAVFAAAVKVSDPSGQA